MKITAAICAALATIMWPAAASACEAAPALDGVLTIAQCDPATSAKGCVPGGKAVYDATEALDIPGVFTIGVRTSPWRMYDGEGRILTVEEVATVVREQRREKARIYLVGSWTAVRPDGTGHTLAQRLSDALDGLPVDGTDGFLWLSPDGAMRTTRQAFSVWKSGPYSVEVGKDVLVPLVPGAMVQFEDRFAEEGIPEGVVEAGIGYDVFMLCQERALAAFERAGGMGSAIGAYNAGLMHVSNGNSATGVGWLETAASMGDAKAAAALVGLGDEVAR